MTDFSLTKIERLLFGIINVLLHPIFMPFYALYIIIHVYSQYYILNNVSVFYLLMVFFTITVLLPSLVLLIMNYLKIISSLHMNTKEERLLAVFTMLFFYIFVVLYFRNLSFPYFIEIFFWALPLIIAILLLSQWLFFKISMHAYGIGSLIGIIIFYRFYLSIFAQFYILASVLMLSGLIISSRLLSNAHSFRETNIGFILGVIVSFLSMLIVA